MEIKRCGSQPSHKGPADWFTGRVRVDPLFQANAPARASGASVRSNVIWLSVGSTTVLATVAPGPVTSTAPPAKFVPVTVSVVVVPGTTVWGDTSAMPGT